MRMEWAGVVRQGDTAEEMFQTETINSLLTKAQRCKKVWHAPESWCREAGMWARVVGRGRNEAGGVWGRFAGHPTWTLHGRPTVSKASRQEIPVNISIVLLSLIELTNSTQEVVCKVFDEVFCSNIIFQDPQELGLCHIYFYDPDA